MTHYEKLQTVPDTTGIKPASAFCSSSNVLQFVEMYFCLQLKFRCKKKTFP